MQEPNDYGRTLARILERNKGYEGLASSPDFLMWRADVLDPQLDRLMSDVLATDRSAPGWKELLADRLAVYQESVKVYEVIMNEKIELARRTRAEMRRLEAGE